MPWTLDSLGLSVPALGTLLTFAGPQPAFGCCIDRDGTFYVTKNGRVYQSFLRHGRYTQATPLAGVEGPVPRERVDGDIDTARFESPKGVCMHPLDPLKLLVMDGRHVRQVDFTSGVVSTLTFRGNQIRGLRSCASGAGCYVWASDHGEHGDRARVLRLDMLSLEAKIVYEDSLLPARHRLFPVCVADPSGEAVVCSSGAQLWTLHSDGTTSRVAASVSHPPGAGAPNGAAASEVHFGGIVAAAAAGDGSIVVAEHRGPRLLLVSPDGTVSMMDGLGTVPVAAGAQAKVAKGPAAASDQPPEVAGERYGCFVSPRGTVLALELVRNGGMFDYMLHRLQQPRLRPPPHLAPAVPPPTPLHPAAVVNGRLLQSGLLADAVIRVASRARSGSGKVKGVAGQAASADPAGCSSAAGAPAAGRDGSSVVKAAEQDVPCHRAVLAAGSPFFEALFAGPMAQQQQQHGGGIDTTPAVVTVSDASAEAVHAVLRHVYTGDLGGLSAATAQDVLYLAQQWGMDGLLEACQAYVAAQLLGPGNAVEWLVCAHLRQYGSVRRAALRVVVEDFEAVRADPAQLALLEAHPRLLTEVATLLGAHRL